MKSVNGQPVSYQPVLFLTIPAINDVTRNGITSAKGDEDDRSCEHERREHDPELPADPEHDRQRGGDAEQRPGRLPRHREPIEHHRNGTGTPTACCGRSYRGVMDVERPPRILPSLVLWVVGAIVAVMVFWWVVGAIFSLLKMLFVVGAALAVIWAILASRSRR